MMRVGQGRALGVTYHGPQKHLVSKSKRFLFWKVRKSTLIVLAARCARWQEQSRGFSPTAISATARTRRQPPCSSPPCGQPSSFFPLCRDLGERHLELKNDEGRGLRRPRRNYYLKLRKKYYTSAHWECRADKLRTDGWGSCEVAQNWIWSQAEKAEV